MSDSAQPMLSWQQRKRLWDRWSILKFQASKSSRIPPPPPHKPEIEVVPLNSVHDTIPISNIQVAEQIPADEDSPLSRLLFEVQVGLYASPLAPMQSNSEQIDANFANALAQAYTPKHRQCFPAPELPDDYRGADKPDLGWLAVAGPYAGYLKKVKNKDHLYEWDLHELGNYQCKPGLRSLKTHVLFEVQQRRLVATQIDTELGTAHPADENWSLAKKIALCAVSTHTALVRHFNWIHLASGGLFALATRNRLMKTHPLKQLLWPHIYGTQLSNQNVTGDQMVRGGKFDNIFSFSYEDMCRLFSDSYEQYSISVIDPERDARERGIHDAPFEQPSQENLKQLFDVIHAHTKRYLFAYYADETSLKKDSQIANWLKELNQRIPNGIGKLINTESIDRASLARFCAGFIYLVTVQHEALGTSLWNYQHWLDKSPIRVYQDQQRREHVDVLQRLLNANFDLNVKRSQLLDNLTKLPLDRKGTRLFREFHDELSALQSEMDELDFAYWRIAPNILELNMSADVFTMTRGANSQLLTRVYQLLEDFHWHDLPLALGLVSLKGIREQLRWHNLHDSTQPFSPSDHSVRSYNGRDNHLGCPYMGAAGTPFGRNFAPEHVYPDKAKLMQPNPRAISRILLKREADQFIPIGKLNLLAAAWIQFQVHDWFAHRMHPKQDPDRLEIPKVDGDNWQDAPIRVRRTFAQSSTAGGPPVYINDNSHWWDGSQVYGSDELSATRMRAHQDGKLKLNKNGLLPFDSNGGDGDQIVLTGFSDNWWVGLSLLHALFTAEHNAICTALKHYSPKYAHQGDEWLYQKARLINSALMAKIHTLEWTTAVLDNPTIVMGMQANWSGVNPEQFKPELNALLASAQQANIKISPDLLARLPDLVRFSGLLTGILGSKPEHHAAPYAMTEEFVSVYRMHPLLPDKIELITSFNKNPQKHPHDLLDVSLKNTRAVMEKFALPDLFYSFGVAHPGALVLHNYPESLRRLDTADDGVIDLAAIDILRDRERGVPRYNQFRRLLGMKPVETFDQLTETPESARLIKEVYNDKLEDVDLMVGLFAEPLLKGLGFSETAFRLFALMASRRLQSDRFFTSDYNEETYTALGLEWIENTTMLDVLKRHHPTLESVFVDNNVANAFHPWRRD